jgi:hypothetical protein
MATKNPEARKAQKARRAKPPELLVELVVRRGAVERFQKLKEKTANLPVTVTWDRRNGDRRTASDRVTPDRRGSDRRQKPPFTWELSDFVVVERPQRTRKKRIPEA